jgi:hypothetical protein
LKKRDSIA